MSYERNPFILADMKPQKRRGKGRHGQSCKKSFTGRLKKTGEELLTGELRLHRDGYGFVVPVGGPPTKLLGGKLAPQRVSGGDVFIPARYVGDALHTDVVEVRVVSDRGGKREGRITKIVERRVDSLMGRLEHQGNVIRVIADDRRVRHRIIISPDKLGGASDGDNVVARIVKYPKGSQPMRGEVMAVLGRRGEEETEREAVIIRHQLKRTFPERVLKDANRARELMNDLAYEGRRDLRDVHFVTIDGENAQDFDDAVGVERLQGGLVRLWVSIADVSFFVRPGSILDAEAYSRGTSVYFPGHCLPMLPETLSNNICSLRPGEDRLTFTAEMDIDASGNITRSCFYRSVIRSRARLTYTAVKEILIEKDKSVCDQHRDHVCHLEVMEECFRCLREKRLARGSIDFDLPEPEIIVDLQGGIEDIVRAERHTGHMMIEEFMIAANEAVAERLSHAGTGCVYRVHEPPPPEKLGDLAVLLNNLEYTGYIGSKPKPAKLAKVVKWAHEKPWERLVNHTLLRSMSQAVYSAENKGHYGLASNCYCHFTSPIRRYPDLVVHRLLATALHISRIQSSKIIEERTGGFEPSALNFQRKEGLQEIADHSSRCERKAMDAEREMAKLYSALFMQDHLGAEFDGIISHVAKFGVFVELFDFFVEGLIHINTLDDDRYIYNEGPGELIGKSRGKRFQVGDEVRVEVTQVDVPNREIFFELV
ncbi:MAG: ribonuclease R [Pseudomonadota bacterium]